MKNLSQLQSVDSLSISVALEKKNNNDNIKTLGSQPYKTYCHVMENKIISI